MKKIVIFGIGDFGRLMKYYIDQEGREVEAFCVNKHLLNSDTFCDLPVVAFEEISNIYPNDKYDILLAIGYTKMNDVRKKIWKECKENGYTIASIIHSSSTIHTEDIGEGNIILENVVIQPFVSIGVGNLIWPSVTIGHDCKLGDFNTLAGNVSLSGFVNIGDNCFIGNSCVFRDHLTIANYTFTGINTSVIKDTKPYSVLVAPKSQVLKQIKSTDMM